MPSTRDRIKALLLHEEQERLAAGAAAGNRVEDHQPAMYLTPTGWTWGCTCGQHAGKRSVRMSMIHVWFAAHVKKLGLPRLNHQGDANYKKAVYMDGPAKGLTWDKAYAQGIDINGDEQYEQAGSVLLKK